MALSSRSRRSTGPDIWPGFVDALATLLMVIMFVLTVFVVGQFSLSDLLSSRDQSLARLQSQVSQLSELLALEKQASADLRLSLTQLSSQLESSTAERDQLAARLSEATGKADESDRLAKELADAFQTIEADRATVEARMADIASLQRQVEALKAEREKLAGDLATKTGQTEKASADLVAAQAQVQLLNDQIAALRQQMARIEEALNVSEAKAKEQGVQIVDLGKRLNLALAGKVEELARYRSEFFGRLREVLGNRPDIRVVGDRFVFQSEVLFPSGSADLTPQGRDQIVRLAETLRQIAAEIPGNINWILRVDGHTDTIPIATAQYPSNWELSTARATSVVKLLIDQGIPPERLAAAGFGEFQPLEAGDSPSLRARNRRIELKLDQR
ncbi:MAG TPA: peptidoglycan -binding protein [Alphaproteobacteria bacterium]|jgi:chemotaxis protein MotB